MLESPLSSSMVISLSNSGVRYARLGLVPPPGVAQNDSLRIGPFGDFHSSSLRLSFSRLRSCYRHGSTTAGSSATRRASPRFHRLPPIPRPAHLDHRSSAARRPLGLCPPRRSEKEDFSYEEAPSADGRQGFERCEEPLQMPQLWANQADPCAMPPLCARYVCARSASSATAQMSKSDVFHLVDGTPSSDCPLGMRASREAN